MAEKHFNDLFTIQLCEIPNLTIKTYYYYNNLYKLECYVSFFEFPDGHIEKFTSPVFNSIGLNFLNLVGLSNCLGDKEKHSLICIQKLRDIIEAKKDSSILLNEYIEICNIFPFFQMYADKIYGIIHASNDSKISKDLLESLNILEQNIKIIYDYLVCGVLYPNLRKNKTSIKHQLFEYEEIREYQGEKKYFLEWDLKDRVIVDEYPSNIHELYFSSLITNKISQHAGDIEADKRNVIRGTTGSILNQKALTFKEIPQRIAPTHYIKEQTDTTKDKIKISLHDKSVDFKQIPNSCNDTALIHEFLDLINYLDSSNRTITRCQNCGRHFITMNTIEKTRYCNIQYPNSKSTCQELMVNLRYKSSQKTNPITKIYTTVYNRVFSRVRRGVLDATLAPYEDLRNMRNKYLLLYDKADESDKKIIENKFAEEINSFANDFLNSHCKA